MLLPIGTKQLNFLWNWETCGNCTQQFGCLTNRAFRRIYRPNEEYVKGEWRKMHDEELKRETT
jgi:hypothetical protein